MIWIGIVGVIVLAVLVFFLIKYQNSKNVSTSHPSPLTPHLPPSNEKRKILRRIAVRTRKLSNQVFAGSYHSAFKGRGMSFSEVREYQYGDDVRAIDWNVTARGGKPYVKVYEEERELTMMLLVDVSKSTLFGTQQEFKKEIIEIISGILAFSAITNNDKVGVIFFSDKVEKYIPPKKGKTHIMRIIAEIDGFESQSKGTNFAQVLQYFNNVNKKKSIAFLISDFMGKNNYQKELSIVARKHDFIGVHLFDKREQLMEDVGVVLLEDAESGETFFADTANAKLRGEIKQQFDTRLQEVKKEFGKNGAQIISMDTSANYVKELMQMFKERGVRR